MKENKIEDEKPNMTMDKIVSLAKRRGFIFQSSEIYGGLNSCYDYGPLGTLMKNNIKQAWMRSMTQLRDDVVPLDSSIFMHPMIWKASGHIDGFHDPLVDCKECKKRWRADHLLEAKGLKPNFTPGVRMASEIVCPDCGGELSEVRQFNLMFKTQMGAVETDTSNVYLRPETAQGIYVNYENVRESSRMKIPFGIAQVGKAFRNEITPGNFIFRTREFEQMEQQYFVRPDEADRYFGEWKEIRRQWYIDHGINPDHLRYRAHGEHELAHYARAAHDIEFYFPIGWKELEGIHNRGDWDLSQHMKFSGKDLQYFEQTTGERFTPWIVETSAGADRAMLAFLCDAYTEIEGGRSTTTEAVKEVEVVLRFHPRIAPYKVAVLPLSKKEELSGPAYDLFMSLQKTYSSAYDETGSIGKRYRRQDEIGTPYCITFDFDSLTDSAVTIRDRDTMAQERIAIKEIPEYLKNKLGF